MVGSHACMHAKLLQSCLSVAPWTAACQAPLSMGFSSQKYWSGLPGSPPGDPPDPGIEPMSLTSPALADGVFTTQCHVESPGGITYVYTKPCLKKLEEENEKQYTSYIHQPNNPLN